MIHRHFLAALLLLLPCLSATAQTARLYKSESGLANTQINEIYQDSRGFVWISTENGLSRFDGMDFTTFRFDRDRSSSIASDLVLSVYEASDSTYWVGTSAGLQTFDPVYNSFTRIDLGDPTVPGSDPHISAILELFIGGRRTIVASSSGHGIYFIDPTTFEADRSLHDRFSAMLPSPFISRIFPDSSGRLWVAAEDGGVVVIDLASEKVVDGLWPLREMRNDVIINAFAEDERTGDILLGSFNYGILIYDASEGRVRKPANSATGDYRVESLLKNNIAPILGDATYIVGLENGGLKIFDLATESISDMPMPNVPYNTAGWKVHSLLEDSQGNLWVGAYHAGVLVLPRSMYGFDYINPAEDSGDKSACVTSILEDELTGDLWIGTDGMGLYRIDKTGKTVCFTSSNSGLSNNSILSLAMDKRGTLWIATYLGGIFSWTPSTGFRQLRDQASVGTFKTVCLAYSREDDILYAGTHGYGMSVVSLPEERVICTLDDDDNKWISTLYIDKTGTVWVGTYNGPMCYDHRVRSLIQYDVDDFLSTRIQSFCEDAGGRMWIGTGEGLVCFDRLTRQTTSYSENNGLPSNVVNSILEGSGGHLWIATLNGLSCFNPATESFRNYYQFDGLQENEFNKNSCYKSSGGRLYFGGINGITAFYPHIVGQRTHPVPPLYFSDLRVMNEPVEYDADLGDNNILDRDITQASMITLPFDRKIFSIKFSVLEYTNPRKIAYSYRMDGFDQGWNRTGADSRVVTYTNLPSGRYTMQVRAYFEDEPEKYTYREIGIRILPPWYKTVWAYLSYLIVAMLLILAVEEFIKRRKLQQKEQEESEIKELKLRMFTNISHEIRTPLTLVMTPLKKMRESETDPTQKSLYNLMYRNCLRILRLVNQLLDMRKIDNGQMQLHFLETDVVYFIRDIMNSFDNLAVSRNIRLTLTPEREVENLWIDQGNFDKIIFNILSNAFKHTPDEGSITISVSKPRPNEGQLQDNVREYVEFIIENSGSRIEERHLDKLFDRFFQTDVRDAKVGSGVGLNLAKMLVDLHHGDIKAYNTETGVAFRVRIPVGNSHLNAEELTKPTNHKDLYTKTFDKMAELSESREDVTYSPEAGTSVPRRQAKTKRNILLVDDDSEMRSYLQLELQSVYNVDTAADGREAWEKITKDVPDAVVTDLVMDGMDGAELCEKVRHNPGTNHIPVILLTSSSDEAAIRRCTESGAERFFTKPISLDILKGAIANAILTRDTIRNKYIHDIDYGYSSLKMKGGSNEFIEKVLNIIKASIERPDFGVEELSREVGMSRVHLNRRLKELLNTSPGALIRSVRLKQAAYLLINNEANVSEVAYKVGFSNHSYFSSSFHDYFGLSPKEFATKYADCRDEETLKRIFG